MATEIETAAGTEAAETEVVGTAGNTVRAHLTDEIVITATETTTKNETVNGHDLRSLQEATSTAMISLVGPVGLIGLIDQINL